MLKTQWIGPIGLTVLGLVVFLGGIVDTAQGAVFAKYDGIDGESRDDKHDKWIDVLSIDWGAHKPGGGMTGQSRLSDVVLVKELDKSSTKLAEAACSRAEIPAVSIEIITEIDVPGGEPETRYLKYELKNVLVTSYQIGGTSDDGSIPVEEVAHNFEEIKVTYRRTDASGNLISESSSSCVNPARVTP